MGLLNRRPHLCIAGLRKTHPSTIEVRGTTTAEPSGAGMERSAARATATESAAATEVATSTESAASKSAPAAAGPRRIS